MSPEQASGDHRTIDSRTDIYSLGVVLYEMLTGELPFKGSRSRVIHQVLHEEPRTPRALNDHIPRDLETICLEAMSKQPARRYATADDMARDLEHYLAGEPIEARPVGRLERAWRWCRRNPLAASVAAAIPLLLLTAALVAGYTAFHIARARDQANLRLSKFSIANGFRAMSEGDSFAALSWFVEASRTDRVDPRRIEADRTRLDATLMHVPKLTGAWFFDGPVVQGLFAPDGSRVVLVGEGRAWTVELESGERRALPSPEGEVVRRIELSPDGNVLLTSAESGAVRAWDVKRGFEGRLVFQHARRALRCKFSPDGSRFLTASTDGSCRIWEAAGGDASCVLEHDAPLHFACFFPDGRRVLTGGQGGSVAVWDLASPVKTSWEPAHTAAVTHAAFSRDGSRVLTTSDDRTAKLWDGASGRLLGNLGHGNHVVYADFSPDGRQALTASLDGYVRIWDIASRTEAMPPLLHVTGVANAVFTSGGKRIFTACYDGSARFWDAASGRPQGNVLFHPAGIWNALLGPEGRRILTYAKDGAAKLWDLAGAERIGLEIPCGGWVGSGGALLGRDGGRLLVGRYDGAAQVWDIATRAPVFPEPVRHRKQVRSVAFSPDGKWFATGSEDGTARVWDASSGAPIGPLLDHGSEIWTVAFSPEGGRLATAGRNGDVLLWDVTAGTRAVASKGHGGPVRQVRFSPDRRFFATASEDRTARIWDARTGAPVSQPLEHTGKVVSAVFSPDGTRLATATDDDGAVRVWRVESGKPLTAPFVLSWDLRHIVFSPDGRSLLVATSDRSARIWDAATGEPLTPEMKHQSGVLHAEFSPDGSRVITAGYDKTAIVWDAASGEPLAPPLQHACSVQYAAFSGNDIVVTVPGDGPAQVWSTPASPRPIEDAALIAAMLSGRKVDAAGGLQVLRPDEFRRAWETLRPKYPSLFTATHDEILAWHQRELRECLQDHLHDAALPHLEVLARANPTDPELEILRGTALAETGRTREALDAFMKALALRPDHSRIGFWIVVAQMKLGDMDAARNSAAAMRERHAGSDDPVDANRAIWISCFHPSFDAGNLVEEARRNAARSGSALTFRHTLAAVLYRAGLFEESLRGLEECIRANENVYPRFWDWLFLSMIEARRGRADDARRWLEKARDESGDFLAHPERLPEPPTWTQRFQLELFLREAETTLGASKDTP